MLCVRVGRWAMVKSGGGMTDLVQGMRPLKKKGGGRYGMWMQTRKSFFFPSFFWLSEPLLALAAR